MQRSLSREDSKGLREKVTAYIRPYMHRLDMQVKDSQWEVRISSNQGKARIEVLLDEKVLPFSSKLPTTYQNAPIQYNYNYPDIFD